MCILLAACSDDALPQLQGDVGDMVGTGDGRAVQRGQVGWLHWWPARSLQVDHHQLLLGQHHQGIGVVKGWGTDQGSEPGGGNVPQPGLLQSNSWIHQPLHTSQFQGELGLLSPTSSSPGPVV